MSKTDEMAAKLLAALAPVFPGGQAVEEIQRLSGGASQETWSFRLRTDSGPRSLVLRRGLAGQSPGAFGSSGIPLATEAELIRLAAAAAVPVPPVRYVLNPSDGLGAGFVMDRVYGETIPRKILRDPQFALVRPRLAADCGTILARIHSIDRDDLPKLPEADGAAQAAQYRSLYESFDFPRPIFELALRWLDENCPAPQASSLVHGDFRNGNLMIGEDGVRAVLDWELAHLGDPIEDLGWLCVNSWRFGEIDQPVGGFGQREDLITAYVAAGGRPVDEARMRFWEVLGTVKWGVICMVMYGIFRSGLDASVERAAIGRRVSETELDLLNLLEGV